MRTAKIGRTKNKMRLNSDASQNEVYCCQNVGPER